MGCFNSRESSLDVEPEQPSWDGHVRPVRSWKIEPALTSAQLTRLRNEFWETRVEGRQEMWQALRFAAEAETVCQYFYALSKKKPFCLYKLGTKFVAF